MDNSHSLRAGSATNRPGGDPGRIGATWPTTQHDPKAKLEPMAILDTQRCPCLSGLPFGKCCLPIHEGQKTAPSAEALMRSRFSAFASGNSDYLLTSWHRDTRPKNLELDETLTWYRLDIVRTSAGTRFDSEGIVEFIAYYRSKGANGRTKGTQAETSLFRNENGTWQYVGPIPSRIE